VTQRQVVDCVRKQIGKPYILYTAGPNSFDCSGLAYYCHNNAIPRACKAQASGNGKSIKKANVQAGDLMFWNCDGSGTPSHTTICVGNGKMIHAPNKGQNVKEVTYKGNAYWEPISKK
jgi:cell wall-associated NlpC family hydrolase